MTTPLAIFAGIPLGPYQRSNWRPERAGWTIRVIPSGDLKRADLKTVWRRVMDAADDGPLSGVHLLLAHDREDERPNFVKLKTKSYRATWLPRGLSHRYGRSEFRTAVDDFLLFEESWRRRVRPDVGSPLLLPETAFSAAPSVSNVWSRARRVDQGRDRLDAVAQAIIRFRTMHRRKDGWRDDRDLVFKQGAPHGGHRLPAWRHRKLTCQFPPGFHFDVRSDRSRAERFSIMGHDGTVRDFAKYTNIDPHGFVRGGH